ncbi:MAG: ribosomal protein L7/L12 [Steroidobacteraceae bacterium]
MTVEDNIIAPAGYCIVLRSYPPEKKIAVINVLRELTGLGLNDAKGLIDLLEKSSGAILTNLVNVDCATAANAVARLQAAGAIAVMRLTADMEDPDADDDAAEDQPPRKVIEDLQDQVFQIKSTCEVVRLALDADGIEDADKMVHFRNVMDGGHRCLGPPRHGARSYLRAAGRRDAVMSARKAISRKVKILPGAHAAANPAIDVVTLGEALAAAQRASTGLEAAAAVLRRADSSCHEAVSLLVDRALEDLRQGYNLEAYPDTDLTDDSKLSALQFCRVRETVLVARHIYQGSLPRDRNELAAEPLEDETGTAACMLELAVQALQRMARDD